MNHRDARAARMPRASLPTGSGEVADSRIALTWTEQMLPFQTAEELLAKKREGVVSVAPGMTVLTAMQRMADRHLGFLVVIEAGQLVGVLSERDCARKVVLGQLAAADTLVRDIMTTRIHSVSPQSKIPECVALMHKHEVRHLPVVHGGEIVGVLSVRDLMAALLDRQERLLQRMQQERLTLLVPHPSSY